MGFRSDHCLSNRGDDFDPGTEDKKAAGACAIKRPTARHHPVKIRRSNLATWSIQHPIGVLMMTTALMVLGAFAFQVLNVSLLPHLIYPEVRVRVLDQDVPASIMEDKITRQLEEQLAITEGAIHVQSQTSQGRSAVDLSFAYGKNIDIALRDASSRLDRAKRFLPASIDPPVIYKRDPSQIPIAEYVLSSDLLSPIALRTWADETFSKWFVTLPGMASVEVGGGMVREIAIEPNSDTLAALGLTLDDIVEAIEANNFNQSGGHIAIPGREINIRTDGRFRTLEDILALPIRLPSQNQSIRLGDIAQVRDTHEDEKLRIRLNQHAGIKISFQKQPQANTVAVVAVIEEKLRWLQDQQLMPSGVRIEIVGNQATYIHHALNNASLAALSGMLLAMLVVYLFLGNLKRTLIIGSTIPIAVMVTFILMTYYGLTLNIMTLGGLALGIGLLVDNTIVMLENIQRHQQMQDFSPAKAASEVSSAIIAATSTNLAAVLPFLFISGLVGLLFRELIFTISAAILSSMIVALTLVPALAARIKQQPPSWFRRNIDHVQLGLQNAYAAVLTVFLKLSWLTLLPFLAGLVFVVQEMATLKQTFLPKMDEGRVSISIRADSDIQLSDMDDMVAKVEKILQQQPHVVSIFAQIGGFVFGRSEFQSSNRSSINVQLTPVEQRDMSTQTWIKHTKKALQALKLSGVSFSLRSRGIRGVRLSRGEDDLSLKIQGQDLNQLRQIADSLLLQLKPVNGISNLEHSLQDIKQELSIQVDPQQLANFGLTTSDIARRVQSSLTGIAATELLEGDRSYTIRVRPPKASMDTMEAIQSIPIFHPENPSLITRLGDLAQIALVPSPASIRRDKQQRVVEITASITGDSGLDTVLQDVRQVTHGFELPTGYSLYDGGTEKNYQENKALSQQLLILAIFLVFVVMAVQYESLKNPFVILTCIPFTLIGIYLGLQYFNIPLSMPVWLGAIMLAGIVVNNAIVLVEYIEIERREVADLTAAIIRAAKLRLRPILMTTLTTVVGMLPLAYGLNEGSEMLRPLAVTIVAGLSFSLLVSLVMVPVVYQIMTADTVGSSGLRETTGRK